MGDSGGTVKGMGSFVYALPDVCGPISFCFDMFLLSLGCFMRVFFCCLRFVKTYCFQVALKQLALGFYERKSCSP